MPLRCVDAAGNSIHSFDLAADDWQALQLENGRSRHLKMPCCSAAVTLKRSRLGTPFFAHKAIGSCVSAPEGEAHLRLKAMVVTAARAHGWQAETEVAGTSPSGDPWRADVLASRGTHKVAVEIQWSGQTLDETVRRQERYRQSGVRGLWLFRRSRFPVTRDLPAVVIEGDAREGFTARISATHDQVLPAAEFLSAAFSRRFQFGVPTGIEAVVSVHGGFAECWHARCRARTRVVTRIEVAFGPHACGFSVSELGEHPKLLRTVLDTLPSGLGIGDIKPRFSKTLQHSYFSNGCVRCDRLFGQFFEYQALHEQEVLHSFPIRISEDWQDAISSSEAFEQGWGVYPSPPGT